MKKKTMFIIIGLMGLLVFGGYLYASSKVSKSDCKYKGFKLYGKVKFVTSFPDLKIKIVDSFPDLKVKKVSSFPDSCGKWKVVDSFPDFKVQVVDSFPDIKVKYVDSFPGVP